MMLEALYNFIQWKDQPVVYNTSLRHCVRKGITSIFADKNCSEKPSESHSVVCIRNYLIAQTRWNRLLCYFKAHVMKFKQLKVRHRMNNTVPLHDH